MHTRRRILLVGICALMPIVDSAAAEPSREDLDFYEQHIRPVLSEHCFQCHGPAADEPKAGLRLDHAQGWLAGGDSGPALRPGEPDQSLLLKALRYDEEVSPMPPDQPLAGAVVERFREWIERGAPAPASEVPGKQAPAPVATPELSHWAFLPPQPASLPMDSAASARATARLDRIIERHLRQVGLAPSPAADRPTLARRLYVDLWGLPPTYAQVEAFLRDRSPRAYEDLVERLLASPRFGERWARMWLDVARFADTKGYVFTADRNYPEAYLFRNWVIRSFNHDRPYDEFVRYQLAADQFRPDSPDDLAAMGFLTLGRRFLNNKHDIIDDRIDVTTRGLMGLTVTCARCHDHKFDPIPMEDYYALYGVFDSSREPGDAPATLRLIDKETPTTPVVFLRGQPNQEGPEVPRRFLRVLAGPDRQPFQHGSGRREMAEAIASAQNPLTARVFVNRVWGRLLGTFLIDTPSDFGVRTTRPPLADVLDELTVDFQRNDWSLKWLVREIVTSATYRQTSASHADGERLDPTNQWYWRMNRRRLDFESLRDAILAVSDQLDASMIGGPSVDIATAELNGRRSLYAHIDRQNFPGLFRAFDVAGPDTHAPKRYETTVPQQALYLLNSPFALDSAAAAARTSATDSGDAAARVRQIYQRVLGRDPDEWEQQRAVDFVNSVRPADAAGDRDQALDVWSELAQVLIMSNEFSYLD